MAMAHGDGAGCLANAPSIGYGARTPWLRRRAQDGVSGPMAGDRDGSAATSPAVHADDGDAHPVEASSAALPYGALDDTALIEAAKTSPDAFGVLYERYVRSVFAFAFSRLHDASAAEDVTSQTFLQALRALPRYQQRGLPFRGWLFRITANVLADRHRSPISETPLHRAGGRHEGDGESGPLDPPDPGAEDAIHAFEQAEDFAHLIADLTPEQRAVVQLRFAEGLPIGEIAARMARSEGAVKMLLLRALQNLRRRMAGGTTHAG